MTKKQRVAPPSKENPKRAIAKKNRNRGVLAMTMDPSEWAAKHDPLYRIKGIDRYHQMKSIR